MDNVKIHGTASRALPSVTADSVNATMRTSRYGEVLTSSLNAHLLSDEGSYFVATNPTVGTGVTGIAASDGFDATESFLHIRNTETNKRIYLDYIKLQATAAGTNGTNWSYAMTTDRGATRYTSGGSSITPVNPNLAASASAPSATIRAGALVTTAASADVRLVSSGLLRTAIKVVGDTVLFTFGRVTGPIANLAQAGTAICNLVVPAPPVVLGENDQFLLHEFGASQTVGAAYTFEIGFWVR